MDLDLHLAWRRIKLDYKDRTSFAYPHLRDLVEIDAAGFLKTIETEIASGAYKASPPTLYPMPKAGFIPRPGVKLDLKDEIVYTALVGAAAPCIEKRIRWAQGDPDVAYQMCQDTSRPMWVKRGGRISRQWRLKSIQKLGTEAAWVAFSDIAGFYEQIEHRKLIFDLESVGIDSDVLHLLSQCLPIWSGPRNRGLPQGYSASDVLAKLYLDVVDRRLRDDGYIHLRYVDDLRIFCTDQRTAKVALHRLSELWRWRGLYPNSEKTSIRAQADARVEIDGVTPKIQSIEEEFDRELREEYGISDPYLPLERLERREPEEADSPSTEVLERAFEKYFLAEDANDDEFQTSLFRFVIRRLGQRRSRAAVDYALEMLTYHREETAAILEYFDHLKPRDNVMERLVEVIAETEAEYDYQVYQILEWLYRSDVVSIRALLQARRLFQDRNRSHIVRVWSAALLGKAGTPADLERLSEAFFRTDNEAERAEFLCNLHRMENAARASTFGRFAQDSVLIARALKWAHREHEHLDRQLDADRGEELTGPTTA